VSSLDTARKFVLDIRVFSSIIYILYEGGLLRPPLVTLSCVSIGLSHHRSRRKNGEEDEEGGHEEEGCEEAVST